MNSGAFSAMLDRFTQRIRPDLGPAPASRSQLQQGSGHARARFFIPSGHLLLRRSRCLLILP